MRRPSWYGGPSADAKTQGRRRAGATSVIMDSKSDPPLTRGPPPRTAGSAIKEPRKRTEGTPLRKAEMSPKLGHSKFRVTTPEDLARWRKVARPDSAASIRQSRSASSGADVAEEINDEAIHLLPEDVAELRRAGFRTAARTALSAVASENAGPSSPPVDGAPVAGLARGVVSA